MRTLIIGGLLLLTLAAASPALKSYNAAKRTNAEPSLASIHPIYILSNSEDKSSISLHGNSFRRFHPEKKIIQAVPLFHKTIKLSASYKADTILNGRWYLQPALPSDTAAGQFPSLNFNLKKKTFNGNTGCNSISGSFTITDSSFQFNDNIQLTKKMCTGYNEAAFLKSLFMSNRYTIEDSVLTFWFNQTELSRWTRKPQKGLLIKKA